MGAIWDKIRFSRFGGVAEEWSKLFWDKARKIESADNLDLFRLLRYVLRHDSGAIDIGAYRGEVLRRFIGRAPDGTHHAFEPVPHLADELAERFPTAKIHRCALSDEQGTSMFYHVDGWACVSSLNEDRTRSVAGSDRQIKAIETPVERLDDVIPDDQRIDFIKVDVEGLTLNVIRGGRQIIERCRPMLVFEYMSVDDKFTETEPADYYNLLVDDLKYTLFTIAGSGPLSLDRFVDEVKRGDTWNFLARDF